MNSLVAALALLGPAAPDLVVVSRPGAAIVEAAVISKVGRERDPADRSGLAEVAASVVRARLRAFESPPPFLQVEVGDHALSISFSARRSAFSGTLSDVLEALRKAPTGSECTDGVAAAIDRRVARMQDDAELARAAFARTVGDPAGAPPRVETGLHLKEVTASDVAAFFHRSFRAEQLEIVIAGPIQESEVADVVRRTYVDWPDVSVPDAEPEKTEAAPPAARGRRIVLVDRPGHEDAYVIIGRQPADPTSPGWACLADTLEGWRPLPDSGRRESVRMHRSAAQISLELRTTRGRVARVVAATLQHLEDLASGGGPSALVQRGRAAARATLAHRSSRTLVSQRALGRRSGIEPPTNPAPATTTAQWKAMASAAGTSVIILTETNAALRTALADIADLGAVEIVGYDSFSK